MMKWSRMLVESGAGAWGPIKNPIDESTLELWRKLDTETQRCPALDASIGEEEGAAEDIEETAKEGEE